MKLPFELVEREVLVKREASTSPEYGCVPSERKTEEMVDYGVINLNKPTGPTSHQIVDYVKKILNVDKAGHSGTLDPKVTGVLVVATGRATRVVETLLLAGKEYVSVMHLHNPATEEQIRAVAKKFTGEIEQLPPIKSAVKRQMRKRTVYYLDLIEIDGQEVLFRMGCEAGTYVRKFVHDFGQMLGTGANMAELVRTKVAAFRDEGWHSLHDLKDAYTLWEEKGEDTKLREIILPMEAAIQHLPKIWITDTAVDTMCHGASLSIPGIARFHSGILKGDIVAVMTLKDELVCLGAAILPSKDIARNEKGLAVKNYKVFMNPGTYPKFVRKSV